MSPEALAAAMQVLNAPILPQEPEVIEAPSRSAQSQCPSWCKSTDKRSKLGQRIVEAIEAGQEQKGRLEDRVNLNEEYFQNRRVRPANLPWDGAPYYHVPVLSPRIEQRKAACYGTLTAQKPFFRLLKLGVQERIEAVEEDLQFALDISNFYDNLDWILQNVMLSNAGIWRVTWQHYEDGFDGSSATGPFTGPVFDSIHIDNFVVYPATKSGIDRARFVGHKFECRLAEVKARQKSGEWFKDVKVTGDDPSIKKPKVGDLQDLTVGATTENDDDNIVFFDGEWRDDPDDSGKEKRYHVVIRTSTQQVMLIEPIKCPYSCYVASGIKREEDAFWTEGSVAQDGQGMQVLTNALVNSFNWNNDMGARPAVLTEGWDTGGGDSLVRYRPGEYRTVKSIGKALPVPSQGNISAYLPLIETVLQLSDSALKVSDTLTGAPATPRTSTATEQDIKFKAFQISGSSDIAALSGSLVKVCKLVKWYMGEYYNFWKQTYGDAVKTQSASDFEVPCAIEISGKSPEDSPQQQAQQAQMLLSLVQDLPQVFPMPVVIELVKIIVLSTSLPNKDDLLRMIEAAATQAEQAQAQQQQLQNGQPNGQPGMEPVPGLGGMAAGATVPGAPAGDGSNPIAALIASLGGGSNVQHPGQM